MDCELCGRSNAAAKAEVEGTLLTVCDSCARLGRRVQEYEITREKKLRDINASSIDPKFPLLIKTARTKLGISLEELG